MRTRLAEWAAAIVCLGTAVAFDPTEAYEPRELEGWTVRVHKRLLAEEPQLAQATLKELEHQLYQITRAVPEKARAELQKITIWVELNHSRHPCACYHVSADWLRANDFNPEKEKSVEIAQPKNFLSWTREQPWMILHELAHGYHDLVLGSGHAELQARFEAMGKTDLYKTVRHINGNSVRHYARTNATEYFAEATEAYFGVNDFYPFVRAELREYDPEMFELLRKLWGD